MTTTARAVAGAATITRKLTSAEVVAAASQSRRKKMIYRTMMRPRAALRSVPPHRPRLVVRHRSLKIVESQRNRLHVGVLRRIPRNNRAAGLSLKTKLPVAVLLNQRMIRAVALSQRMTRNPGVGPRPKMMSNLAALPATKTLNRAGRAERKTRSRVGHAMTLVQNAAGMTLNRNVASLKWTAAKSLPRPGAGCPQPSARLKPGRKPQAASRRA